jgi:hypothetical protein
MALVKPRIEASAPVLPAIPAGGKDMHSCNDVKGMISTFTVAILSLVMGFLVIAGLGRPV